MLVRVYRSVHGTEFRVHHDLETNTLVCTCKEFRGSEDMRIVPGLGMVSSCRHIRQYKKDSAAWDPDPLATLDWI